MIDKPSGTYPYPLKGNGWVCFHCGERFTDYVKAKEHFGEGPHSLTNIIAEQQREIEAKDAELPGYRERYCAAVDEIERLTKERDGWKQLYRETARYGSESQYDPITIQSETDERQAKWVGEDISQAQREVTGRYRCRRYRGRRPNY